MEEGFKEQLDRIERNTILAGKNVLILQDVAIITGLSKNYLYKLTCTHQIPFYRPNGKQMYFDRKEIENWLKKNRIASNEELKTNAINHILFGKEGGTL